METAQEARKAVRSPAKEGAVKLREGEYRGRNGEILVRERNTSPNKFDFPDSLKEPGWSYQWIRHSVYGDLSMSEMALMKRNGWREVTPDQLKGYFRDMVPDGQNFIEIDGLVLVERPEGMTKEAQQEALHEANRRYAAASIDKIYDDQARSKMPAGIEPWLQAIRQERSAPERAPDDWKPTYKRSAVPMDGDR